MEVLLSFHYTLDALAGHPDEFAPSVAVWTTDPHQPQTLSAGMAVDLVPLDHEGNSTRSVSFTGTPFPILDPSAELCVALYAKSESDGSNPKAGKKRPFVNDVGQVSIPWHVILRFLVSNGHAQFSKTPSLAGESTGVRAFPKTTIEQEVTSMVTTDAIEYDIAVRLQSGDKNDKQIAQEMQRLGSENLAKKGTLSVRATLLAVSDKALKMTLQERLDVLELYFVSHAPGFRGLPLPDPRVKLGHIHDSDFVKAAQNYDKETDLEERAFMRAIERYKKFYDSLWIAVGSGASHTKNLLIQDASGDKTIVFKPDVPSMFRFHLPIWVNGNDLIPYAEWWLHTLPEHTAHMPKPGEGSEKFLRTLALMAFKRVDIKPDKFVKVVQSLSRRSRQTALAKLDRFLVAGSKERSNFIRCTELVFHAAMMVAHACRYNGDRRFVKFAKTMMGVDCESPQHNAASGVSENGDCEDVATLIAIFLSLILTGRDNGDAYGNGRGWTDPVLDSMRCVLQLYCDFNIFGSVCGRQLSDATPGGGDDKEDDEEGLIDTPQDRMEPIGGHSYQIQKSLGQVASDYKKHADIVDAITGFSVHARIKDFIQAILRGWIGSVGTASESDARVMKKLYTIWKSAPGVTLEGTGRQEPLLLALEEYFALGREFLQRIARHASELDVLERWPRKESGTHEQRAEKDKATSKMIKSMGEAAPYMFQRRLTVRSSMKHDKIARHLSPFYRRVCHSVSSRLFTIMPEKFVHLIWINPDKRTYGPPLRLAIETRGEAIAVPLNVRLHLNYMKDQGLEQELGVPVEQRRGDVYMQDLLNKRMRRIIPFDLSFEHLSTAPFTCITEQDLMPSSKTKLADATLSKDVIEIPQAYSQLHFDSDSHEHFFCRSASKELTLGAAAASASTNQQADAPCLVIRVPSDGAVAQAMRTATGDPAIRSCLFANVNGSIVTRPPEGIVTKESVDLLAKHVASGQGVLRSQVYSERVLPWLSDHLCATFSRSVRFVIDDKLLPPARSTADAIRSAAAPLHKSKAMKTDVPASVHKLPTAMRFTMLLSNSRVDLSAIAQTLHVDTAVVPLDRLAEGMMIELEHSTLSENDIPETFVLDRKAALNVARIALAHFVENPGLKDAKTGKYIIPDYYHLLKDIEQRGDKLWEGREKPAVFLAPNKLSRLAEHHNRTEQAMRLDYGQHY